MLYQLQRNITKELLKQGFAIIYNHVQWTNNFDIKTPYSVRVKKNCTKFGRELRPCQNMRNSQVESQLQHLTLVFDGPCETIVALGNQPFMFSFAQFISFSFSIICKHCTFIFVQLVSKIKFFGPPIGLGPWNLCIHSVADWRACL